MIIDAHAHVSDTEYGNADIYIKQLKDAGIDGGILVPGGMLDVRKMTDYIIGRTKLDNPIANNAYVEEITKSNLNLWSFVCINPHSANALQELEAALKRGARGLKLSPITHQFSFASTSLGNLLELYGSYSFPIYSHVVYSPGASTEKFIALAKKFPKINFIIGHMGFGPADQDALDAAYKLDNFFLETSTGNFLHLKEAAKLVGPTKIIYGSEFPLSHPTIELKKILMLDLSDDDKEKILCKNILSVCGITEGG